MAGKYIPLENHLRGLSESQREVTLRFEQIESILHFKLPASAYEDRRSRKSTGTMWWEHTTEGELLCQKIKTPSIERALTDQVIRSVQGTGWRSNRER